MKLYCGKELPRMTSRRDMSQMWGRCQAVAEKSTEEAPSHVLLPRVAEYKH